MAICRRCFCCSVCFVAVRMLFDLVESGDLAALKEAVLGIALMLASENGRTAMVGGLLKARADY
jgi:hypothetical protein